VAVSEPSRLCATVRTRDHDGPVVEYLPVAACQAVAVRTLLLDDCPVGVSGCPDGDQPDRAVVARDRPSGRSATLTVR
jgi:hypothetical protein